MSGLVWLVFAHLLGALALFIGYGIEWTASSFFRNASSVESARVWLRLFRVSPPLSGAGLAVLILSGGYLASLTGTMRQGWIPATFVGIAVALLLGFGLILPRMRKIRAALPAQNDLAAMPNDLRTRLSDPVLLTAIRIRVLLAAGIVYLMVAKLPFAASLTALAATSVIGFLCSVSVWSRPRAL